MALVLKRSAGLYKHLVFEIADSRTHDIPLLGSPIPVITILIFYLLFVLKWGPDLMAKREPFKLKTLLIVYNVIQMVSCIAIIFMATPIVPFKTWTCNEIDRTGPGNTLTFFVAYLYFVLKITDLLDTVFFVLKKNYRQITFLHVFHHTLMVWFMWVGMKYFAGGQGIFLPYINCVVHVVMYGYYLLSVYDEKYKSNIWWKKYITQLQLVQFGMLLILFSVPLYVGCGYPKVAAVLVLILSLTMVALFSNFYYNAYIKKSKRT